MNYFAFQSFNSYNNVQMLNKWLIKFCSYQKCIFKFLSTQYVNVYIRRPLELRPLHFILFGGATHIWVQETLLYLSGTEIIICVSLIYNILMEK